MKIRKMLRGIPLLFLMVSGLSVFLSCKGPSSAPTFYTVTFNAQGGSTVASLKVEHGKTVEKPADPVKAPYAFGGWYKESTCTTSWNFATDTVTGDITLYAQWKITIKFDSKRMTCNKNNKPVNDGATVYERDELNFDAKLPKGELIDHWRVNDVDKNTNTAFHYTVDSNDVNNGTIIVSYNTKKAAKATISFDSNKMTCTKDSNTTTVETGDEVYEKDLLFFTAKLPKEKIGKWTVNGEEKKKEGDLRYFSYTIKADDAGKTLTVAYTEK